MPMQKHNFSLAIIKIEKKESISQLHFLWRFFSSLIGCVVIFPCHFLNNVTMNLFATGNLPNENLIGCAGNNEYLELQRAI